MGEVDRSSNGRWRSRLAPADGFGERRPPGRLASAWALGARHARSRHDSGPNTPLHTKNLAISTRTAPLLAALSPASHLISARPQSTKLNTFFSSSPHRRLLAWVSLESRLGLINQRPTNPARCRTPYLSSPSTLSLLASHGVA